MPVKSATPSKRKSINDYLRLMREAKNSGAIGRIFKAIDSIERIQQAHKLIPSTLHAVGSLYNPPVSPGSNLFGELIWGSIVLQRKQADIESYLTFKRSIETLVLHSKWKEALSLILDFELRYGTASVIIELEIAITQQAEGTVKQVAFARRLEAQSHNNASAHFVRFSSERNEDRLTLSGFRRSFREHRLDSPLAEAVIYWHALHHLPNDEELLSQLLGFEGSGSLFDYFEAFIGVATHLATRGSPRVRAELKNCLQRMVEIDDQRIINLRRLLREEYAAPKIALTAANVLSEIAARSNSKENRSPMEEMFLRFLDDKFPEAEDRRSIHKLSANFFHLDFFQAVYSHMEHKASVACLDQAVAPSLAVLSDNTTIRSVFACNYEIARKVFAKSTQQTINGAGTSISASLPIEEAADSILFAAIALAKSKKVDEIINLARRSTLNAIDQSHLQLIAINACYEAGRYIDLLPFALDISEIRLDALSLTPIVDALEKILPGRLNDRDAVVFSIVTSRVLLIEDSDRLEDKLMVAAEIAFSNQASPPSWVQEDAFSRLLWVVFLRDILVVQNMLLIDEINSLQDALNLRVKILRQLVELDPENRSEYHEEVRDIAFNLSVDEGVRQVNTSRLNVNIQGLTKWANDHCIDDYERYKELVIGEASAGETKFKLSTGGGSILDQVAGIPFGKADDQLIKLLVRIRNAYLSDPRNGLDAYISLRVRHGSLAGTLSRGLDTRQLLLLRKAEEGPFEAPKAWIDRFNLSETQITEVTKAFAVFTLNFRKSIDDLMRYRLRVRNERNPKGEITVEITDIFVKGFKIDILDNLAFDAFISAVFIAYKNTVSAYLESLRKYLKEDFFINTVKALEQLSSDFARVVIDTEKQGYLDDAITNARLDLQGSIRMVCGWLEIAQKEDLAQLYTLNQATEIGLNYTRQVRNGFQPNISVEGADENFKLTGTSLVAIVDILFILLDNVYKHAGVPNERNIMLSFDLSEQHLIKIRMRNDLAPTTDRDQVALKLDEARKLVADSEGEKKLTEEDKSGFPKLSRLVVQDREDSLIFELVGNEVEVRALVGYSSLGLLQ